MFNFLLISSWQYNVPIYYACLCTFKKLQIQNESSEENLDTRTNQKFKRDSQNIIFSF